MYGRDSTKVVKRTSNSAYPKVVSNLGTLGDTSESRVALDMIRFMNHYARSIDDKIKIINFFTNDTWVEPKFKDTTGNWVQLRGCDAFKNKNGGLNTKRAMGMMSDLLAVGFANTVGYAHPLTGDTMTSVMIGGLRTVMNGDFEIFPGDPIQFYWCFEKDDFLPDGRRKPYLDIWDGNVPYNVDPTLTFDGVNTGKRDADGKQVWKLPEDARIRQAHYNLSYGQKKGVEKYVAKIKPYFRDDYNPRMYDWVRVFAVALSCARPNEMCDIKISRQSV